jgi:hypothetical protein
MARPKRVLYKVTCAFNPSHIFEKEFEIKEGAETVPTKVEAYCPFCDKKVTVTVNGIVEPDEDIHRSFDS